MVKRVVVENFKNVDGLPFNLTLKKQGRNLNILLENNSTFSSNVKLLLMCSMMLFALSSLLFNVKVVLIICAILIALNLYTMFTSIQYESLVVVESLGYQIETKYLLGHMSEQFIPTNKVQNIFINEVILQRKVIYLLTLLSKVNEEQIKLNPLFLGIRPRLDCLELVYRHLKDQR